MLERRQGLPMSLSCHICQKVFSRLDHLTRHVTSAHSSHRDHVCSSCRKAYKRLDVLRRHQARCEAASGSASDTKTPKRRRACDRCVAKKRACNNSQPCTSCTARGDSCTYAWLNPSNANLSAWEDIDEEVVRATTSVSASASSADDTGSCASVSTSTWRYCTQRRTIPRTLSCSLSTYHYQVDLDKDPVQGFRFLLRFTSPGIQGISGKFNGQLRFEEISSSSLTLQHQHMDMVDTLALCSQPPADLYSADLMTITCDFPTIQNDMDMDMDMENLIASLSNNAYGETQDQGNFSSVSGFNFNFNFNFNSNLDLDPLAWKSQEILLGIRDVATARAGCLRETPQGQDHSWSPALEQMCVRFFDPPRLRRYLEYYWASWYPHWPTIHRPTFDAVEAPRSLVAAMAVTGACTSPEQSDREDARCWRNYVEELVFDDVLRLRSHRLHKSSSAEGDLSADADEVTLQLRALQAATIVCMYQIWEGSQLDGARVRQSRWGTVVTMGRALIPYAKHRVLQKDTDTPETTFNWHHFALAEQVIRTVLYVFLMDCYFVIFHIVPPKMSIQELRMDLASPDECFQAQDAATCFHSLWPWASLPLFGGDNLVLYGAIKHLGKKPMDDQIFLHLARAGILNLWVLCASLHILIFNLEPAFGCESQFVALDTAIANWRRLWNHHLAQRAAIDEQGQETGTETETGTGTLQPQSQPQPQAWTRPGLMRFAPEWWLLARHVLQRIRSSCQADLEAAEDVSASGSGNWRSNLGGASIIKAMDTTDTTEVHDFISRCSPSSSLHANPVGA